MKTREEYFHLYLGCDCIIGDLNWKREEYTHDLAPGVDLDFGKPIRTKLNYHILNAFLNQTTLILRPLDERLMTQQEKTSWNQWKQRKGWMPGVHAEKTLWLLSNGFDVFGLGEEGLAIYE